MVFFFSFSLLFLLLVSIYNKADASMVGWEKVHAYKLGPDSDNIRNTVQIEMWLIAIYRIRWIRLRVLDEIYICIWHCNVRMRAEKRRKVFFLIALELFDSFLFVDFVYCRPSLSRTYKNFMRRSKVLLLLLLLLSHTLDLTEI